MAVAIAEAGYPLPVWAPPPRLYRCPGDVPYTRHEDIKDLAAASDIVALCVGTDEDVLALRMCRSTQYEGNGRTAQKRS